MRMFGKKDVNKPLSMGIFGKKKLDEEEEILEEEKKDKKLSRDLKDLSPENKKKRKEPPKPWGKKERLIVLVTLLVTVLTAAILALSAREYAPKIPKFSVPNFDTLNIFGEKTIILEKSN